MKFNKEDFDKFCDILNKLSSITPDVEIVNSKVCQLGSDTSYNIYADMSNLIKEPINFGITNLNAKYPILRMMKNTTSGYIEIIENNKKYIVTDGISDIEMTIPDFSALNTKYNDSLRQDLSKYTKVLSIDLDKTLIKKLNESVRILGADEVGVKIEDNKGKLVIVSKSKTSNMNLISDIDCNLTNWTTTINDECFKSAVSDDVHIDIYKKSEIVSIISIETEINGIYVNYRQLRSAK